MQEKEQDFSFKKLFFPLTTLKAIHIIIIVGFIVYGNMLFNNFAVDDNLYIINNSDVHSINLIRLFQSNLFNNIGQYRPIPATYFAILYALSNNSAFFYHFLQLIIHIINTFLLFLVFKHFIKKKLSLILSLFFLIHPIQVESVSYIAATVSPLFFIFGIMATLLGLKEIISNKRWVLIYGLLVLSLLTKETGILFIFMILVYRILIKKDIRKGVFFGFVSLLIYSFFRIVLGGIYFINLPLFPLARMSLAERLINIPAILFYYIKTIFFPYYLSADQNWFITKVDFFMFYLPLLIDTIFLCAIGLLGSYIWKKARKNFSSFIFFLIWFLTGIAIHLQIFTLDMTVAERWIYFALAGLLGIIGVFIQSYLQSNAQIKKLSFVIVLILIIILSIRTMVRNTNWKDTITVLTHDAKISDNYDIENQLGYAYGFESTPPNYYEALKHFKKSVEYFPFDTNLFNVGTIYDLMGDKKKAIEYYYYSYQADGYLSTSHKHIVQIYSRLGWNLLTTSHPENALKVATIGLHDYPDSAELWGIIALYNYKIHHFREAVEAAEKVVLLSPGDQSNNFLLQIQNKNLVTIPLYNISISW